MSEREQHFLPEGYREKMRKFMELIPIAPCFHCGAPHGFKKAWVDLAGAVLDCFEGDLERKPDTEFAVNVTKLRGIAKNVVLHHKKGKP